MSKAKASPPNKLTVVVGRSSKTGVRVETVGRVTKTGQFVSIREAKSRPSTVTAERIFFRDSKTGSFTTKKSTETIKSNVERFSDALASLAKK